MSRRLFRTSEYKSKIKRELENKLSKIAFDPSTYPETTKDKAVVVITMEAKEKMSALVNSVPTEIAWHGLARKLEKGKYEIYDILVYPQVVTSVTVSTDQEKYETWLLSLDDESFNALRMHGHSHVNMGVSPSGVDLRHQEDTVNNLSSNDFYLFLILNKKGEIYARIFDVEDNTIYEKNDIKIIWENNAKINDFVEAAKRRIEKTPELKPDPEKVEMYSREWKGSAINGFNEEL